MLTPQAHLAAAYVLASVFSCDPQPAPPVHFNFVERPPRFVSDLPSRELRALGPVTPGINPRDFPVTSGITQGVVGMTDDVLFKWQELVLGGFCLYPTGVTVTVTYDATVHIATEYPRGSCRYAETEKHEQRHVRADEDVLKQELPGMRATAEAWAAGGSSPGPFDKAQLETMRNLMAVKLKDALERDMIRIDQARSARQREIDTPQEYERLSRACPAEPLPRN